jgi:hypothetical protein
MRDGHGINAPSYKVGYDWVPFRNRPHGVKLENDPEVEVKVVTELPKGVAWSKSLRELRAERLKAGTLNGAERGTVKRLQTATESKKPKDRERVAKAAAELNTRFGL